jgi:hypothetical protein
MYPEYLEKVPQNLKSKAMKLLSPEVTTDSTVVKN